MKMTKSRTLILLTFLVGCLSFNQTMGSEYYTWVDENGIRNYGEKVPVGYEGSVVDINSAKDSYIPSGDVTEDNGDDTDEGEEGEEENGSKDEELDIAKEDAAVKEEIAALKKKNCEIAKRNLARLQNFPRIRVKGEDGEERVMGEDEKQAKMDEVRKNVQENCSG